MMLSMFVRVALFRVALSSGQYLKRNPLFNNLLPNRAVLPCHAAVSLVGCAALCAKTSTCVSIFYEKNTKLCHAHDRYIQRTIDGYSVPNVWYYTMNVTMVNGFDCTKFTGSCLKLLSVPQSWDDAADFCESLNSRLVMVDDITENNILQKLLTDNGMSAVWLGVSDVDYEGFMVDIDGDELGYQNFYNSQPDDGSECVTHDCVIMSGSLGYQWDDVLCSSLQYACCEIIV